MSEARSEIKARLQVVAAAVLFSTGGVVIKATALTGWHVARARRRPRHRRPPGTSWRRPAG